MSWKRIDTDPSPPLSLEHEGVGILDPICRADIEEEPVGDAWKHGFQDPLVLPDL